MITLILGLVIIPVEAGHPQSSIEDLSDGLWWSFQTLTTVGYGDVVPVTNFGRLLGLVMQIIGTLMFGSVIAMVSSSMSRSQEEFYWTRLFERLDRLEGEIAAIKKETKFVVTDQMTKSADHE
jgi:voltage-gated potassium channel